MAKKALTLPTHKYWYIFPTSKEPERIEEQTIPAKPYERFEIKSEAIGYLNTHVNRYCSGAKSLDDKGCPRRFECAKFSKFHKVASEGKFRGLHSADIFKFAPYNENDPAQCKEFENKF